MSQKTPLVCNYQLFLITSNSRCSVTSSALGFGLRTLSRSSVITVSAEFRRDVILKNPVKAEYRQSDVSDGDALIRKLKKNKQKMKSNIHPR